MCKINSLVANTKKTGKVIEYMLVESYRNLRKKSAVHLELQLGYLRFPRKD